MLVIDDEPLLRSVFTRILSGTFAVSAVSTAEQALTLFEGSTFFAAILCDLHLPGMSGEQFTERLRELVPAQADRVILMSGENQSRPATQGRFLPKPFKRAQVLQVVGETVDA